LREWFETKRMIYREGNIGGKKNRGRPRRELTWGWLFKNRGRRQREKQRQKGEKEEGNKRK
jgi:hypothetical protein